MISEVKSFGFDTVELDFGLRKPAVEQLIECVEKGDIKVSSVHNFCPIPDDPEVEYISPNIFPISSPDETERQKGVNYTLQTIDYAVRLGAKAVVIHSGAILMKDRSSQLIAMMDSGKQDTRKFLKTKIKLLKDRNKRHEPYVENLLRSYEVINKYAVEKNILIGIENRYHAHELPDIEEADYILRHFDGGNLRYWHDVGHAQLQDNLGIFYHEDYVSFFKNRIAGIHIHDIVRSSDHRAPGTGVFEFERIWAFLRQDIIKVIEVHHPTSPNELKLGIKYLTDVMEKMHNNEEKNISPS